MADQVLEEGTAYMSKGMYADNVLENGDIESNNIWANKGYMMHNVFEYAAQNDLNLHIHQIGDEAATFALNELEKVEKQYPELKNNRVCFAHCQFIKESDKKRMKELGVSAIVAPYWAVMDDYYWDVYLPIIYAFEKFPEFFYDKKALSLKQYIPTDSIDNLVSTGKHIVYGQ